MTQECDLLLEQMTFLSLEFHSFLHKSLKNSFEEIHVMAFCFGMDDDVVQKLFNSFPQESFQNSAYLALETAAGIFQSHRQGKPLVVAERDDEGCLLHTVLMKAHVPISPSNVQR